MTNRFFLFLMFFVLGTVPAFAQDCQVAPELIFKMKAPTIGSYNVWDSLYGTQDTDERFVSGVFDSSGLMVLAGERSVQNSEDVHLFLVGLGRNGRKKWEMDHEVKGLRSVVKILRRVEKSGDEFLVVANVTLPAGKAQRGAVWLGRFDIKGTLLYQKVIKDSKASLSTQAIIPAHDEKNYMIPVFVEGEAKTDQPHAALYKVTPKGDVLSRPAFLPGAENNIMSLMALPGGDYLAAGYLQMDDGRRAGWALRMDEDGIIAWQRPYARGAAAWLNSGVLLMDRFVVLGGQAHPSAGHDGHVAAWLMALNADTGEIGWQRYYTGEIDFAVQDMSVSAGGLISVLVDGTPVMEGDHDYVRLMTVTSRGHIFSGNEYFNGEGTDAFQFIIGPDGRRYLAGRTRMAYQIEQPGVDEIKIKRSAEGWVLASTIPKVYEDPCLRPFGAAP